MEVQQKPFAVLKTELEQSYKLIEPEEIREFLEEYPYLDTPLLEIPDKLKQYFPDLEDLRLFYSYDYESPKDSFLAIMTQTHIEQDEVFDITDRFHQEWFGNFDREIQARISISVIPMGETEEDQIKFFEALKPKLEQIYELVNPQDIQGFVQKRKHLETPLLEIPAKLNEYFSDLPNIQLRLVRDYEYPAGTALGVYARTGMEQDEKFAVEERFEAEWWNNISSNINDEIVVRVY